MIEESYKDGQRVAKGDPEATWEVRCVSWGWNAIQLPEHCQAQENDRNFPKFDQAEAYAVEKSKQTAHANIDAAPIRVLPEMVECDCGHECGAAMVMSASMGTACPDCYDMMSD